MNLLAAVGRDCPLGRVLFTLDLILPSIRNPTGGFPDKLLGLMSGRRDG